MNKNQKFILYSFLLLWPCFLLNKITSYQQIVSKVFKFNVSTNIPVDFDTDGYIFVQFHFFFASFKHIYNTFKVCDKNRSINTKYKLNIMSILSPDITFKRTGTPLQKRLSFKNTYNKEAFSVLKLKQNAVTCAYSTHWLHIRRQIQKKT